MLKIWAYFESHLTWRQLLSLPMRQKNHLQHKENDKIQQNKSLIRGQRVCSVLFNVLFFQTNSVFISSNFVNFSLFFCKWFCKLTKPGQPSFFVYLKVSPVVYLIGLTYQLQGVQENVPLLLPDFLGFLWSLDFPSLWLSLIHPDFLFQIRKKVTRLVSIMIRSRRVL